MLFCKQLLCVKTSKQNDLCIVNLAELEPEGYLALSNIGLRL